jgi:hypothetical protein
VSFKGNKPAGGKYLLLSHWEGGVDEDNPFCFSLTEGSTVPKRCALYFGSKDNPESRAALALLDSGSTLSIIHTSVAESLSSVCAFHSALDTPKPVGANSEKISLTSFATTQVTIHTANGEPISFEERVWVSPDLPVEAILSEECCLKNNLLQYNAGLPLIQLPSDYAEGEQEPVCLPLVDDCAKALPLIAEDFPLREEAERLVKEHAPLMITGYPVIPAKYPKLKIRLRPGESLRPTRPRRFAPPTTRAAEATVQELLEADFIVERHVPSAAQIVVVTRKPDPNQPNAPRRTRICVDLHQVNEKVEPQQGYVPHREDILNNDFKGMQYFTQIDFANAYGQFEVDEESSNLLAFMVNGKTYASKRLMLGLTTAPAIFNNILDDMFKDTIGKSTDDSYVIIRFFDNILIGAKTPEATLLALRRVLAVCKKYNLSIQANKSEIGTRETVFMGFSLSPEGISIDKTRLQGLLDMAAPTNRTELRALLGTFNYVRGFVPNFATIAKPLTDMTSKKIVFDWTPEMDQALKQLKEAVTAAPTLAFIDYSKDIFVTTDASAVGAGAVLWQLDGNNEPTAIAIASRAFNETESRWANWERELFAVHFAFTRFESYILGHPVILESDCSGIRDHRTSEGGKVGRWMFRIGQQAHTLVHIKGSTNTAADCLSRLIDSDLTRAKGRDAMREPRETDTDTQSTRISAAAPPSTKSSHDATALKNGGTKQQQQKHTATLLRAASHTLEPSLSASTGRAKSPPTPLSPSSLHVSAVISATPGPVSSSRDALGRIRSKLAQAETVGTEEKRISLSQHRERVEKEDSTVRADHSTAGTAPSPPSSQEQSKEQTKKKRKRKQNNNSKENTSTSTRPVEQQSSSSLSASANGHTITEGTETTQTTTTEAQSASPLETARSVSQNTGPHTQKCAKQSVPGESNPLSKTDSLAPDSHQVQDSSSSLAPAAISSRVGSTTTTPAAPPPFVLSVHTIAEDKLPLLAWAHGSSVNPHGGMSRTIDILKEEGKTWKNIKLDVASFVSSCPICQLNKASSKGGEGPLESIAAHYPFECFSIDTVGPIQKDDDGFSYIFMCIDDFSRFAWTVPIKSTTSVDAINALTSILSRTPRPGAIRHDAGPQFRSQAFAKWLSSHGIENIETTPGNHQGNGIVERCIRSYMEELRKRVQEEHLSKQWSRLVEPVTAIYNNTKHSAIKAKPIELLYPSPARVKAASQFLETETKKRKDISGEDKIAFVNAAAAAVYADTLLRAQEQQDLTLKKRKEDFEKQEKRLLSFAVGDLVLLILEKNTSQLIPDSTGPWQVEQVLPHSVYIIKDIRAGGRKKRVHIRQLAPFDASRCPPDKQVALGALQDGCYIVEEILDHENLPNVGNRKNYNLLVKFVGFSEPDWIHSSSIAQSNTVLKAYLKTINKPQSKARKRRS